MTRPIRRMLPLLALLALAASAPAADFPPVPADAAAVLTIDVKSVLKSPTADLGKLALDGLKPGEWEAFVKTLPFDPAAVERVTVIAPTAEAAHSPWPRATPTSVSALVAVTLGKKFDPAEVLKGYGPNTRRKVYAGVPYQFDDESWSGLITLPGDTTLVVGSEDAVVWYIDRLQAKDKKESPFAKALGDADKHALQLLVNPAAMGAKKDAPPDFAALLDAKLGVLAMDVGKGLKFHIRLEYDTEDGAKDGAKAVKAVATMARNGLKSGLDSLEKQVLKPEEKKGGLSDASGRMMMLMGLGALRRLDTELEAFPVEQKGTAVVVNYDEVKIPEWAAGPGLFAGFTFFSYTSALSAASFAPNGPDYQEQEKRRKKLLDALAAYESKNGQYPPAVVKDKKGQPLYSWRVALLPYLGEDELFKQFKQDEPWDGLNNKKLIAKMPKVYEQSYATLSSAGKTRLLAVVGPGTVFDPKGKVTAADIKQPADTLLWVETTDLNGKYFEGVYWTKPADAEFDGDKAPDLFGKYDFGGFSGMTADGQWRYVNKKEDGKKLPGLFLVEKK